MIGVLGNAKLTSRKGAKAQRFFWSLPILFLATFLLCCGTASRADDQPQDLHQLRKKLIRAIDDSHTTDSLYTALDAQRAKTPLTTAYLGALDALKAKHTWNPYSKIKYLNVSEKLMDRAVTLDPHNIEILFMRFSIQYNLPGFLGYDKNLAADRQEMITQLNRKNYGTADRELTISIIRFLLDSKKCTPPETTHLHQQLITLQ